MQILKNYIYKIPINLGYKLLKIDKNKFIKNKTTHFNN